MNWLQSILYGLVAGLSEFLPVSSDGHEVLILRLLGVGSAPAFYRLAVHLGMVLALYSCCHDSLKSLYKELELSQRPKRRRSRDPIARSIFDIALVHTAFFPLAAGFFCYPYTSRIMDDLQWVALFMALNGIALILPPYIRSGNKDSLSMSQMDGVLLGIGAGLGVIPGFSRMAAITTIGSIRGAKRQNALHWALLISIPALAFMLGFDVRDLIVDGLGIHGFAGFIQAVVSGGFAYLGSYFAIQLMRFLSVNAGYSAFSYYCWGSALFSFVLYLI